MAAVGGRQRARARAGALDRERGGGLVHAGAERAVVDNVLRPILVGKDTKMPDYVVLISTLGGLATFGLNGFVIGPVIAAMFIAAWDIASGKAKTMPAAYYHNYIDDASRTAKAEKHATAEQAQAQASAPAPEQAPPA